MCPVLSKDQGAAMGIYIEKKTFLSTSKCQRVPLSVGVHVQYRIGVITQYMRMRDAKTFASAHHYIRLALFNTLEEKMLTGVTSGLPVYETTDQSKVMNPMPRP
jgi:hypothetical protein